MQEKIIKHPASFRDPSGNIFIYQNEIYRGINLCYSNEYKMLNETGLYKYLIDKNYLIPHEEFNLSIQEFIKVLKPKKIPFISYSYEWSFSQLKDAALHTLDIQEIALNYGMCLKDASSYNIQFYEAQPILIDSLSFEIYQKNQPWIAYKQFCQHFLVPLALMSHVDIRFSHFLKNYIDGIPLDLASSLLPKKSWLNIGLLMHIHLHAIAEKKHSNGDKINKTHNTNTIYLSKKKLLGIIQSLKETIQNLKWSPQGTEWADYYQNTNYTEINFEKKKIIVENYLNYLRPQKIWDLGANNGYFSSLAKEVSENIVAFDIDPAAVEINYMNIQKNQIKNILPLILDLTNPSPSIGWANKERDSLKKRGPVDCIMALALIHHLSITYNIPLEKIAEFLASLGNNLIIEFIPKSDSQVQRLLKTKKDFYVTYTQDHFEKIFSHFFEFIYCNEIEKSGRCLYLMKKKIL